MLFVLLALSPLLAVVLLVLASAHVLVTGRERPARSWAEGAVIALGLGYVTYAWGAFHAFTFPEWDETCLMSAMRSGHSGGFVGIEHEWFPVKAACVRSDGTAFDMVPAFVNPVVYVCLTALVFCATAAVYVRWRKSRTQQRTDAPGVAE